MLLIVLGIAIMGTGILTWFRRGIIDDFTERGNKHVAQWLASRGDNRALERHEKDALWLNRYVPTILLAFGAIFLAGGVLDILR